MDAKISRRKLLAASASGLAPLAATTDFAGLRNDFPWVQNEVFLNNAGWHPIGVHSIRAMQSYLDYKMKGPGDGREDFQGARQDAIKRLFAQLIHARPSEISFVPSTLVGENLVVAGLGIPGSKWNVDRRAALRRFPLYVPDPAKAGARYAHREAARLPHGLS